MKSVKEKQQEILESFGYMHLSMTLHELGWQVNRAYISESIDFSITKYYCTKCKKYSDQLIRYTDWKGKRTKCVTNLCKHCKENELKIIIRYLIVETSEGIATDDENIRKFSFHPKIRYNFGDNFFYVWIAIFDTVKEKKCHYYILNTKDVEKFDNINLPTYQITDNQKTELPIRNDGVVIKKSSSNTGYDYSVFNTRFYNDFSALEIELNNSKVKKKS